MFRLLLMLHYQYHHYFYTYLILAINKYVTIYYSLFLLKFSDPLPVPLVCKKTVDISYNKYIIINSHYLIIIISINRNRDNCTSQLYIYNIYMYIYRKIYIAIARVILVNGDDELNERMRVICLGSLLYFFFFLLFAREKEKVYI